MRRKPKRYQNQHCLHFITFSCYRRMNLIESTGGYETFENVLEQTRRWYGFYVAGYVVMPEHVHLLISEPERGRLSIVIQMLKQITSRRLRPEPLPQFRQVRHYDFSAWSEAKRVEKLHYIHNNPVTRGLVERPEDWPWSSFRAWAEGYEGRVEIECPAAARKRERTKTLFDCQQPTLPRKARGKGGATS